MPRERITAIFRSKEGISPMLANSSMKHYAGTSGRRLSF